MSVRERHVLVVDDDETLLASVTATLQQAGAGVRSAHSLAEATASVRAGRLDVLLADVHLPDGTIAEWLRSTQAICGVPVVAMSGCASAWQGHELAMLGARAFVAKPFTPDRLLASLECAIQSPPTIASRAAALVGVRPLYEVERAVRDAMVDEALSRAASNRRGAARLLQVSRQVVQHILRNRD